MLNGVGLNEWLYVMEHYEIRQQVKTVEKRWLETIHKSLSFNGMKPTYDRLIKENPEDYFELIKVTHNEECLHFTPKFDV